jgi:RNA polymerase sigma-70 factor (ECF subfamily)
LELLERWKAGDEQAADELYRRYVHRLGSVVADHVAARFQQRVDPEDVMQSAYRTFFRRAEAGDFQFDDDADLWKLLVTIALNKVRRTVRRLSAGTRDVRKESSTPVEGMESIAHGPKPEEIFTVVDLVNHLCDSLGDRYGQILKLRLEGCSQEEIASQLGVTDRTVRRRLDEIRVKFSGARAEE